MSKKEQSEARKAIRSKIFSAQAMKPASIITQFNGADIEVRQPTVGTILDFRQAEDGDRKQMMIDMFIRYCFVPGTDEAVFEEGDLADLVQMPFGKDYTNLQEVISKLSNVNLAEASATKN